MNQIATVVNNNKEKGEKIRATDLVEGANKPSLCTPITVNHKTELCVLFISYSEKKL